MKSSQLLQLLQVQKNQLWGYIDLTGEVAIPMLFEYAGDFSEGLAPAMQGGKWGYIDEAGDFVIEPKYPLCWPFAEGRAIVETGEAVGAVDRRGDWVVTPEYDEASAGFSEGIAFFARDGRYACVDLHGQAITPCRFESWSDFSEGLASTRETLGGPSCYIGRDGRVAIARRFRVAYSFSEGLAFIQTLDGEFGFVDHSGGLAIAYGDMTYVGMGEFSEGVAPVRLPDSEDLSEDRPCIFIDHQGRQAVPGEFYSACQFSDGMACVRMERDGPWGYIDRTGGFRVAPRFGGGDLFRHGVARVARFGASGDEFGWINCDGDWVWEPSE